MAVAVTSRTAVLVRKDRYVPTLKFDSGTFTCSIRAFQNPTPWKVLSSSQTRAERSRHRCSRRQ